MNTTTTLPAPANGDSRYSIVTLAQLLCVPPAVVDARISINEQVLYGSDDIHSNRYFASYRDANGYDVGDCWLEHSAAERIAAELPTGLLARRIASGDVDAARLVGPDQIHAIANHLTSLFGATS